MITLQAIEICVFLGLACAWNQPNTCYERTTYTKDLQISALQETIKKIEEKVSILQTYLEEILENTTSSNGKLICLIWLCFVKKARYGTAT